MEAREKTIVEECIQKWNNGLPLDERLTYFCDNFETWMEQIPLECRPLVLTLIQNLQYYSHRATNKWLLELHRQLLEQPNVSDENTIYAFIKSKYGKTNSSNDYWTEYKYINGINRNICIENMDSLDDEDWQHIKNIVFIDDFSGSGKSFIDELKKNPARYKGKNVYFVVINVMHKAVEKIGVYGKETDINIIVLSAFQQEKAFERGLFEDDAVAKTRIIEMSKDLQIPKDERLGYKKTQALVAFYNNTPNNTLGFIRYDTDKYKSIFPRQDDYVPKWMQMKKSRQQRKQTNYNIATMKGN